MFLVINYEQHRQGYTVLYFGFCFYYRAVCVTRFGKDLQFTRKVILYEFGASDKSVYNIAVYGFGAVFAFA